MDDSNKVSSVEILKKIENFQHMNPTDYCVNPLPVQPPHGPSSVLANRHLCCVLMSHRHGSNF